MSQADPKTVLYLHSSAGHYGADRQLLNLVEGLDPSRYRAIVHLAQDGPLAADLRAAGAEVAVSDLAVVRRELLKPRGLLTLAGQLRRSRTQLRRLVRERKVAIIHSNTSVILSGAAVARAEGLPHVWHVREIYSEFAAFWRAYRPVLVTARRLLCVSDAVACQFESSSGARPTNVQVMHDGLGLLPRKIPQNEARAALDLPQTGFVCAVLGRISPWKGQEQLITAFARAALSEDAVCVVAGDAWADDPAPGQRLRDLAQELHIDEQVKFTGFVDDVALVYAAADVIVVPSTQPDPLPNTAIEAAAAGRCVIGARHGGLSEIIVDGATGLLVEPENIGSLAAALSKLSADSQLRSRLGQAAREGALERFSSARMAAETQLLYDEIASV